MDGFIEVGKAGDLLPGQMKMVDVDGEPILLANINGELHAVSDVCSHAGASLSDGTLEGEEVECPLHGNRFNVITGAYLDGPGPDDIARYTVEIRGDVVLLGPA